MKEFNITINFKTNLPDEEAVRKGFQGLLKGWIKGEKYSNDSMEITNIEEVIDNDTLINELLDKYPTISIDEISEKLNVPKDYIAFRLISHYGVKM